MMNDDEGWLILKCLGVLLSDERTNERTDICDCRVTFTTENLVVFKVYCNTFVLTFQCSETSLTSSESKQDETKLDKANIQCR